MPSLVPALALLVTILQVPSTVQRTSADATAHARTVLAWLNHFFIARTGPSVPAEYQTAGHVAEEVIAEEVITDIAAFIRR